VSSYGTQILEDDECRRLLAQQRVGRIAITTGDRPAILPVIYALMDGDIVFRTAPGDKLVAAALHQVVAFETDTFDLDRREGWSVDVVGTVEEIVHPAEIGRAESLGLDPWAGSVRDRYVRVRAEHLSGRRVCAS
jgi:nitroimidazol reductase NimA-like FMN-containing flavoprotein (pyridoxamine 5'-phosphate oxidase superfamily)